MYRHTSGYRAELGDKIRVVDQGSPYLRRTGTVVRVMDFRPGVLKVVFDGDPVARVVELMRQQCVLIKEPAARESNR